MAFLGLNLRYFSLRNFSNMFLFFEPVVQIRHYIPNIPIVFFLSVEIGLHCYIWPNMSCCKTSFCSYTAEMNNKTNTYLDLLHIPLFLPVLEPLDRHYIDFALACIYSYQVPKILIRKYIISAGFSNSLVLQSYSLVEYPRIRT